MSDVRVTVAICTRDRSRTLQQTLPLVLEQVRAPDELVVVDNGSRDDTVAVVEAMFVAAPAAAVVVEDRPGLSSARNRALQEARGDVVAFLDDDAMVVPGWLDAVRSAFADPSVVAFGGRIVLAWPDAPPPWFHPALGALYAALDLGEGACDFPAGTTPYGANMAVRRRDVLAVGGFDTGLGRDGSSLLSNEETAVLESLRARGRLRYDPRAEVRHIVAPGRVSVRWAVRRCWWQARSDVAVEVPGGTSVRHLVGLVVRLLPVPALRTRAPWRARVVLGWARAALAGGELWARARRFSRRPAG